MQFNLCLGCQNQVPLKFTLERGINEQSFDPWILLIIYSSVCIEIIPFALSFCSNLPFTYKYMKHENSLTSDLMLLMSFHTGDKPYECAKNGRNFATQYI